MSKLNEALNNLDNFASLAHLGLLSFLEHQYAIDLS
jgi:hypothetical protein